MNTRHRHTIFSTIQRFLSFHTVALFLVVLSPGCHSDKPALGKAALSLRDGLQVKLDLYSAALAEPMSKGDRKRVKAAVENLFSEAATPDSVPNYSVAVLDRHGTTVTTTARAELSAIQNYGNYHAVSRVMQKRKTIPSSLYLQGGETIFIVCAPLIYREKLAGILIIGIDDDLIHQAGITDAEFMSFTFTPHPGTP